jgi:hypothetical protein|tara:strand:- start:863 stop:1054 length:192 start_codon:yes stop_codon:yes gene_type:complete
MEILITSAIRRVSFEFTTDRGTSTTKGGGYDRRRVAFAIQGGNGMSLFARQVGLFHLAQVQFL